MAEWRLLDTGVLSAAENVALDEAVLKSRAEGASPDTVRFLQYSPPAVLIGYHQSPSQEIRLDYCRERSIDLGRRITGGGAILFDTGQLGWEVIAARGTGGLPTHHAGLYPKLCGAVAKALRGLGVAAEFRPRNDIEIEGRKISGTGGVEEGGAFLFQGTLLVDFDLEAMVKALRIPVQKLAAKELASMRERVTWLGRELGRVPAMDEVKRAVADALSEAVGAELVPGGLNPRERELLDESLPRFRSREWLFKIDRPARERGHFSAGRRTEGGTIRIDADVDARRGRIQSLVMTGDFFCEPRRAALDLEARFKDCPVDRARVSETVAAFLHDSGADSHVEFLGLGAGDLAGVIWDAVRKSAYVRLGFAPAEADRINVSGGDMLEVLSRGATRLLLPYCAKDVACDLRYEDACDSCGRCATGDAYDLGRELGLEPVTITNFEHLEAEWRRMAEGGVRAYVGSCCEPFFTKHRREFEETPVPGVLVDLESATCYDLGQAREAHEGRFEGRTELKYELLAKLCRLAAERRDASGATELSPAAKDGGGA
ncbi:MAG: lipoyl protein ligase domain-containing protein [Planctomycetota bacterium]